MGVWEINLKPSKDNTFCVFPFEQVCIKHPEVFSPCCNSELPENNFNPFNINKGEMNGMTPIDMFEHDSMKELREYGLNNKRHPACNACWKLEDVGQLSPRLFQRKELDTNDFKLKCIDTSSGNECNLRCMMCYPGVSSGLQKDVKYFKEHGITLPISWGKGDDGKISGPLNVWEWLSKNNYLLEELKVAGGEPFYDKDFQKFLDKAHPDLLLTIHTNATKIKMDKIKKFKKMNLIFSIDGTGKTYEYIRYPMTWKVISRKIKEFKIERPQDKLQSNFVLSSLNALNLADYVIWCNGLEIIPNITYMHPDSSDISIFNLSKKILEECLDRYNEKIIEPERIRHYENIPPLYGTNEFTAYDKLQYAWSTCKDNPKGILNYIEKFDKSRNRSYKDFLDPMMVEWLNEQ